MDKIQKYKNIRRKLEYASNLIAIIIGMGISYQLGIYGKKLVSFDTALSLVITVGIFIMLNNICIKVADKWYDKNIKKDSVEKEK